MTPQQAMHLFVTAELFRPAKPASGASSLKGHLTDDRTKLTPEELEKLIQQARGYFYIIHGEKAVTSLLQPYTSKDGLLNERTFAASVIAACEHNVVRRNPKTAFGVGFAIPTAVFFAAVFACTLAMAFGGVTSAAIVGGVASALPFLTFLTALGPVGGILAMAALFAAAALLIYIVGTGIAAALTGETVSVQEQAQEPIKPFGVEALVPPQPHQGKNPIGLETTHSDGADKTPAPAQ